MNREVGKHVSIVYVQKCLDLCALHLLLLLPVFLYQGTLPVGLFKVFEDGCKMNSNGTYCIVAISKIFSDVQSASSFEVCD